MMAGIYVHLPFCPYICPYCDFAKWPYRRTQARRYLRALLQEVAAAPAVRGSTLFLGGGTPNTLPVEDVVAVLSAARARFAIADGAEISVEVNPDAGSFAGFAQYVAAGATRFSVGVQSFDEGELRTLGRRHSPRDVATCVAAARSAGARSVNVDLIFAVPGQTQASWRRTLESALALGVDHVSCYGLTVEEGTPYAQWQRREPSAFLDDAAEAQLYAAAIECLEHAGFEHYEISNFARPGHRCTHNWNYWQNGEYLGLGVGAASYLAGERSVATKSLEAYCGAIEAGEPAPRERERLSPEAAVGEAIMLLLRTAEGLEVGPFNHRYGVDIVQSYRPAISRLEAAGLIETSDRRIALTPRGRFLANDVCAEFLTVPARAEDRP
ncbi:MAG: radical SAM family heme chaperone HemW [bacterium]|nr:radical SAM family heme chaperone HemW [bacterium]